MLHKSPSGFAFSSVGYLLAFRSNSTHPFILPPTLPFFPCVISLFYCQVAFLELTCTSCLITHYNRHKFLLCINNSVLSFIFIFILFECARVQSGGRATLNSTTSLKQDQTLPLTQPLLTTFGCFCDHTFRVKVFLSDGSFKWYRDRTCCSLMHNTVAHRQRKHRKKM